MNFKKCSIEPLEKYIERPIWVTLIISFLKAGGPNNRTLIKRQLQFDFEYTKR